MERELDGPQSFYRALSRRENLLPLPGIEPLLIQHIA
jgi:hypothetical protein